MSIIIVSCAVEDRLILKMENEEMWTIVGKGDGCHGNIIALEEKLFHCLIYHQTHIFLPSG